MTKAEQLADDIDNAWLENAKCDVQDIQVELRRLAPMEMELAGTKASSIARQAELMAKNEVLKARIKELEDALKFYADKTNYIYSINNDGDGHFDVSESNVHDDDGTIASKALGDSK